MNECPLGQQVIGKAGANVEQLQRSSAARIQLSRSGEFYPGEGVQPCARAVCCV